MCITLTISVEKHSATFYHTHPWQCIVTDHSNQVAKTITHCKSNIRISQDAVSSFIVHEVYLAGGRHASKCGQIMLDSQLSSREYG